MVISRTQVWIHESGILPYSLMVLLQVSIGSTIGPTNMQTGNITFERYFILFLKDSEDNFWMLFFRLKSKKRVKVEPIWVGLLVLTWEFRVCSSSRFQVRFSPMLIWVVSLTSLKKRSKEHPSSKKPLSGKYFSIIKITYKGSWHITKAFVCDFRLLSFPPYVLLTCPNLFQKYHLFGLHNPNAFKII